MKVLILGGTNFLGPHFVNELQECGHEITLFNRGNSECAFSDVEQLHGDRDGNLESLKGRFWDVVIDTSGYLPRLVKDSSKILADSTGHYTFISTISVYQDFLQESIDENYPVAKVVDVTNEEINIDTYGALKAACEDVVKEYFSDRSLIVRPGLIVGPLDPTNRFSYWPIRASKGGEILAPGNPSQSLQFIDVRDLVKWTVSMIEKQATGTYNATGPASTVTFGDLLQACQEVSGIKSKITWVSEDFLIAHEVQDWTELPLWLSCEKNMPGFMKVNIDRAVKKGLNFRPLSETIHAILEEYKNKQSNTGQLTLSPQKEQNLLQEWKV